MRITIALLAVPLLGLLALPSRGQLTEYTNSAAFQAAVGAHPVLGFTDQPVGTLLTTEYSASHTLTFSDGDDMVRANTILFPVDGRGLDCNGSMTLSFAIARHAFGVDYPGAVKFDLFLGAAPIGSTSTFGGAGTGLFAGVTSVQSFDRVVVSDWSDGFAFVDDVHFDDGHTSFEVYCTAKLNSQNCLPAISSSGSPSVAFGDDLIVRTTQAVPQQPGALMWSLAPASLPFGGGTLCVAQPARFSPALQSGGAAPCSGVYQFTFTKPFLASHGLGAGLTVFMQMLSRDPGFAPSFCYRWSDQAYGNSAFMRLERESRVAAALLVRCAELGTCHPRRA